MSFSSEVLSVFRGCKRIKSKQPIYIGDTINDVIAAKKAGMKSVFVGNDLGDYQIKNVNNLLGEIL